MLSKKAISFVLLILTFFYYGSNAALAIEENHDELFEPREIKDGISLSVLDCVANAFKNSPKIRRQKYNLDVAESNLGIARSQYFPVINAGVGFYNENNSNSIYYDNHYRELPSVGVSINKMVWNFGKTTAYIKMEEFYKLGAEYEFMDSLCATLFDVKAKYYNLLNKEAMLQISKENAALNEDFVKLAKDKSKADLTTAELNLSEAKLRLIEAQKNFNNAKTDLNNSMYLDSQPNYKIDDTKTFAYKRDFNYKSEKPELSTFVPIKFNFPLDNAVEIAYDNSPDLNVLIATKKAMEQSLLYVKRTYLPDLSANAGYGFNKSNINYSNNSLQVGVSLSSSVNLMELRHSIKGADAQVNLAENEIKLFKKDLYFEVKRAINNIEKTEAQVPVSQTEAQQALENLKVVTAKYKSNELDYVALQNARKDYIMSLSDYVKSLYDYNMALIQMEMAMHYHIVDIHHKSEHAMHYHSDDLIQHLNQILGCDEKDVIKNRKKLHRREAQTDL